MIAGHGRYRTGDPVSGDMVGLARRANTYRWRHGWRQRPAVRWAGRRPAAGWHPTHHRGLDSGGDRRTFWLVADVHQRCGCRRHRHQRAKPGAVRSWTGQPMPSP